MKGRRRIEMIELNEWSECMYVYIQTEIFENQKIVYERNCFSYLIEVLLFISLFHLIYVWFFFLFFFLSNVKHDHEWLSFTCKIHFQTKTSIIIERKTYLNSHLKLLLLKYGFLFLSQEIQRCKKIMLVHHVICYTIYSISLNSNFK